MSPNCVADWAEQELLVSQMHANPSMLTRVFFDGTVDGRRPGQVIQALSREQQACETMAMPLKYPAEWKYEGFPHEMTDEAHRAFLQLVEMMAEGVDSPKAIFEDFKSAYGSTSASSDVSWAESDMRSAIRSTKDNAARYIASFYVGMESVKERGIEVPTVKRLNKILAENDVPLVIEPPYLLLREGDIELVPEDVSEEVLAATFIPGPEIGRGGFGAV